MKSFKYVIYTGVYIDDLWNRIGGKLKSKGITPSTITKTIKASRKSQ